MSSLESSTNQEKINIKDMNSIKTLALNNCAKYLGGAWKSISLDDFKLEKISGGLSNYLYKCEITNYESFKNTKNEPKILLLRLYGEVKELDKESILKDLIVSIKLNPIISSPKIYGIFDYGRLEEYIDARSLKRSDFSNPKISLMFAKAVAKFHTIEMPLSKESSWFFKFILRKVIESLNSPIVFCHMDLYADNCLNLSDSNGRLLLIDYEESGYNHRGYDIGAFFSEMVFSNNSDAYPYFEYNFDWYPSTEYKRNFISTYVDEFSDNSSQHSLKNFNLDLEKIMLESEVFGMLSMLYFAYWSIIQASISSIKFGYMVIIFLLPLLNYYTK